MANTVNQLNYANTFGDWMVTTDALASENNILAKGDYTKDSGTLTLNESTKNALVSNGVVVFQNQLLSQGVGSSVTISNDVTVKYGTTYLKYNDPSKANLALVVNGQANVDGLMFANGSGIGLSVTNNAYVGGNTTIRYNTITDQVQANSLVLTANLTSNNYVWTNQLQANTRVVTEYAQANTLVITDQVQSNSTVNTATLSVTGTSYTNVLQANTSTNTKTLSVTDTTFTDKLQANSSVNTTTASITTNLYTDRIFSNTKIEITGQDVYINSTDAHLPNVIASSVQVNGNFIINGQTVYTSNTFTLAQGVSGNQNGTLNVYRPTGANAVIRWNEGSGYWDIRDVNNSSSYSKILTANLISDSVTSTSQSNIASSNAANILNSAIITANTSMKSYVDTANTSMKSYVDTANTNLKLYVDTANTNLKLYVDTANTSMKSYVDTANNNMRLYVDTANTSMKSYVDTANTSMKSYVDTRTTTNIAEGTNLYFTTARGRLSISASGSLSYNSTTGIMSYTTPSTSGISEGTNLYYTDARARAAVSVSGSLSYNSTTGVISYTTPSSLPASDVYAWAKAATKPSYTKSEVGLGNVDNTADANKSVNYANYSGYAGYLSNSYAYTNGTDGWFRSTGSAGWYNATYSGGIFMEDTTWVKVYGSKAFYVSNDIASTGNITAFYSDERLKTRLGNINGALDAVTKLNGFRYVNNDVAKSKGYTSDEVQLGVSAQEVESLFPEIVSLAPFDMKTLEDGTIVSKSGDNFKTVDYSKLVPVLIEAIKELKSEIDQLKNK